MAVYNGMLYLATTTTDGSINVWNSFDGVNFVAEGDPWIPSGVGANVAATSAPSLVVFNGNLYAFWESDFTSNGINSNQIREAVMLPNGFWQADGGGAAGCEVSGNGYYNGIRPVSGSALGVTVFNNDLYVASQWAIGQGNGNDNQLGVCSLQHGLTLFPSLNPAGGVTAATYENSLYIGYKSNDSNNYLEITGTQDGVNFTTPATQYPSVRINGDSTFQIAPSLLNYDGHLYVFETANDNTHYIYQEYSTN